MKTAQLRQSFLDYFAENDHRVVPSSPVIPFDDPTILFTNAGMNQFKDIFTGKRRVDYKRAASCQKCIRAGGKHNDLDNVGFTARHHTFFEMLGNFSFGDYFKEEAIYFAWEWVTGVLDLPVDQLYATVYETDDEAFELWEKIAPELKGGRVLRFGKKDNYWAMGDIGPAGPCSEVHYDRGEKFGTGPQDVVNGETERFAEIWNLVFMQYDQQPDGKLVDLPSPSVDTGAGLERIATIMQGVESNYQIDIFKSLIEAISEITHANYKKHVSSHHVVADHLRALTFAIADGAGISNEGQGYVLRRILRRASRHGRLLGAHEPFIFKLVPVLVEQMGDAYPEIVEKQTHIENVIKAEEESFGRTLETGLELFERIARKAKSKVIPGEEVFRLYDTYGFPYDLTEIMAVEKGLTLDREGFDKAMQRQREQSRAATVFENHSSVITDIFEKEKLSLPATEYVRTLQPTAATILDARRITPQDEGGEPVAYSLVLDKTPFYAESGGQVSDVGRIYSDKFELEVRAMYLFRDAFVHEGLLTQGDARHLKKGATVTAEVDFDRRWDIQRNHTVTHLTHAALRKVLGGHIKQSGSYVGPDRMRFDFSHHQPMTPEEINAVEQIVNSQILKASPVRTEITDIESARKTGAMALFGEKYEDKVRVVSVDDFSKELCGGTHVDNVSQIGPFFITLETGIASGVRRLEAVTGREAIKYMLGAKEYRRRVADIVGRPEIDSLAGVELLKQEHASLQKELKRVKSEMFSGARKTVGEKQQVGQLTLVTHDFGKTDRDIMAGWIDSQKALSEAIVAAGLGTVNGKATVMLAASAKATRQYKIDAGAVAKVLLSQFGGRGGGKASFAQGTVAADTNPKQLFAKALELISKSKE
ncbi:MAG: alanine--tRNA ligase [Candidatus Zixiibacteriota bacterium]|nr:MAG: alanine--tRNA ligase [candidate division Zixibacteria bacterium]